MQPSRRAIAKGAAWAAPSLTLAVAAPASAASPAPGLQGWIYWSKACGSPSQLKISMTPSGTTRELWPNGDYGFYVFNATAKQVAGACVTFSYPKTLGTLTWTAMSGNGAWSRPVSVAPVNSNVTTYQMCYQGTWQDVPASGSRPAYTTATSYPSFSATTNNSAACQNSITVNISRTVSVNGTMMTFARNSTF